MTTVLAIISILPLSHLTAIQLVLKPYSVILVNLTT